MGRVPHDGHRRDPAGRSAPATRAGAGPDTSASKRTVEPVAWILTACNPRSVVLDPDVNAKRHERMGRDIAALGLIAYTNLGYDPADPTWNEAGRTSPREKSEGPATEPDCGTLCHVSPVSMPRMSIQMSSVSIAMSPMSI